MNLTIRDTRTLQRKLDAETIVTQGFINFQFRPQLSYAVSDKLSVTAYFDRMMNNPLVSNAFFRSTAAGGFQIRYSLSE
jgi:cell surface protein SprA